MPKTSKKAKKEIRIMLPAEYTEGSLHFKTGPGWKACYDSERKIYTAESYLAGYYDLYEINEEIFNTLKTKGMKRAEAQRLISTGRHLYKSVSDRNSSYDIALDENYVSLCPWAEVQSTGELWDKELTDLAVAVFDSEKQNHEQRLKRENTQEQTNRWARQIPVCRNVLDARNRLQGIAGLRKSQRNCFPDG
jgi:hypothetical protein